MFEKFVKKITNSVVDNALTEMKSAWVTAYTPQINDEVKNSVDQKQMQNAQQAIAQEDAIYQRNMNNYKGQYAFYEKAMPLYTQQSGQYKRQSEQYKRNLSTYQAQKKQYDDEQSTQSNLANLAFLAKRMTPTRARPIEPTAPKVPIEPTRPTEPQKPTYITKNNLTYPQAHENSIFLDNTAITQIKEDKTKEYEQKFADEQRPRIEQALRDQIALFEPLKIAKKLFAKHRWLGQETKTSSVYTGGVAADFLTNLLSSQLLSLLTAEPLTSWRDSSKALLTNNSQPFTWNPEGISEQLVDNTIEGYPLSKIENFYINQGAWSYSSLRRDSVLESGHINGRFCRVDLFRILYKLCSDRGLENYLTAKELNTKNGKIQCTQVAPLHIDELASLSQVQFNHFQTLVINVASEDAPVWVIANKEVGQWVVYAPPFIDLQGLQQQLAVLSPRISTVNFEENAKLNNIKALANAQLQWHAVAFARVLPWCLQSNRQSLANYRSNVPLSLLWQEAVEHSLAPNGETNELKIFLNEIAHRKPFSSWEIYEEKKANQNWNYLLKALKDEFAGLLATASLTTNFFDEKNLVISKDQQQISVKAARPTAQQLVHALNIVYHNPSLSRLEYAPVPGVMVKDTVTYSLFNYDCNLKTVKPLAEGSFAANKDSYSFPLNCAARNRFLEAVDADYFKTVNMDIQRRQRLWERAGEQIFGFYKGQEQFLNLDLVNRIKEFNQTWLQNWCDQEGRQDLENPAWAFNQLAQMGSEGINALFDYLTKNFSNHWNELNKEPIPALPFVFDTASSLTMTAEESIQLINTKIIAFGALRSPGGCAPLFSSFSLILPDEPTNTTTKALLDLTQTLNDRKTKYENEVAEITLYNLDISSKAAENFLLDLQNVPNLLIIPRFPEWDRAAYDHQAHRRIKALYRRVQNQVLENQRQRQFEKLMTDVESIQPVDPEAIEQNSKKNQDKAEKIKSAIAKQPWPGDDVVYPLSSQAPGIQQQMQQQVAQQVNYDVKQQTEAEEEYEYEQEQEVVRYANDEKDLITRININEKGKVLWAAIPAEAKALSGWQDESLEQLFSLWVGSQQNAPQVIEKIEPEALKKIMAHATKFRLGIAKDNLPPGFYLNHSRFTNGLILCYSQIREKEDLRKREAQANAAKSNPRAKNRCNPFTVELHQPLEPTIFKGDFRQFAYFHANSGQQQTVWKYLATEDKDALRITNALNILNKQPGQEISEENASASMQRMDAEERLETPKDYRNCLAILRNWANRKGASPRLQELLFSDAENTVLSQENLKALGQLFNQYNGKQSEQQSATEIWLTLADNLLKVFGEKHFAIWKARLLDPSKNWTERLAKKEMLAINESLSLLQDNKPAQKLWWALVNAHGKSVGPMDYSELWQAYKVLHHYVNPEQKELIFNPEAIIQYLKKTDDFNGQVFLDRLYRVLKIASHRIDSVRIQQEILNNIDQIDWRHNGFYYASRYEKTPHWDEQLALTEFTRSFENAVPGYTAPWAAGTAVLDLPRHALRFASQRLQYSKEEFKYLTGLYQKVFANTTETNLLTGRLLMASLLFSSTRIDQLNTEAIQQVNEELQTADKKVLTWLNAKLSLNERSTLNFQLRFEDIASFTKVVAKTPGLLDELMRLSELESLEFINACGRALHCYKGNIDQFDQLMQFALRHKTAKGSYLHPLLLNFPWLINQAENDEVWQKIDPLAGQTRVRSGEKGKFLEQLQSIDYSATTYLPSAQEIKTAISDIDQDRQDRKSIISNLIKQGCVIKDQSGLSFRPLHGDEITLAKKALESRLKGNYKTQNLLLFGKLVEHCLAVKTNEHSAIAIKHFVELLAGLDNKYHYNELAPVLGLLISKSKISAKEYRYYSLTQLTSLVEAIQWPPTQAKNKHYGVDLLNDLMDHLIQNPRSDLLNTDLGALSKDFYSPQLKNELQAIARADLPNQYKPRLVKLAIEADAVADLAFVADAKNLLVTLHTKKIDPAWLAEISELLIGLASQHRLRALRKTISNRLSRQLDDIGGMPISESLQKLWQNNQIKLIHFYKNNSISPDDLQILEGDGKAKAAYISAIVIKEVADFDQQKGTVFNLRNLLESWSEAELGLLANYYCREPNPSLEQLPKLLTELPGKTARHFIHRFESVYQALDKKGESKRHYSISERERKDLNRVLSGFKRKGHGFIEDSERKKLINLFEYANAYSQKANLDILFDEELQAELATALRESKNENLSEFERHQASARLLACMRETLLRKSGKWANHTQTVALLYAALHNDDSMIHQVRTGQGKSIITILRASYLALNGYVVDVFSAKESLSERDHEEFASVLEGMAIRHNYIPSTGKAGLYQTNSDGKGAVNYCTMGNFSLFHSGHIWKGSDKIDLTKDKRVAFIDEADHVLTDEQTQFNRSDNRDDDAIYNLDEWVYRVTYRFYVENKDSFKPNELGIPTISRKNELKKLCKLIQQEAVYAPKESRFLDRYIISALSAIPEEIEKRDQQLRQLLTAAHVAHQLKNNSDFCIQPSMQVVSGGMVLQTRFAKVMIKNQVKDGSTYSDLVHQFLHVRLNEEAAATGETPNFFIEPSSQVALSQNASYLLRKYYSKLEGCTGTAGDENDVKSYDAVYDIKHVIKLPTHEEIRTTFLPPIFCDNEQAQVNELVTIILANDRDPDAQPILITCEDDIAVKKLAGRIKAELELRAKDYDLKKITVDTNDVGKSEAEVVPGAGILGAVTLSSRLGRGTDIKPQSKKGLMVLRTYPTIPRVVKQEQGRQGRNGALGTCRDIINYSEVEKQFAAYEKQEEHNVRLLEILRNQRIHFDNKLEKNKEIKSTRFEWAEDSKRKECYLVNRALQQFKHELKSKREKYLRRKEYLIAVLSGEVMDVLHERIGVLIPDFKLDNLKERWLDCRKKIEASWNNRLAGKKADDDVVYTQFFAEASAHWQTLCDLFPALNNLVLVEAADSKTQVADLVEDYIQQQMKQWGTKLVNLAWKPTKAELNDLNEARKRTQKLLIQYHPDKNPDNPAAEETAKRLTELNKIIADCRNRSAQEAPPSSVVEPVVVVPPPLRMNPEEGVLNLYQKPLMANNTNAQQDMDAVIGFYQAWVEGADKHYFKARKPLVASPLKDTLYKKFDALFANLYKASYYNPEYTLDAEQQLQRRIYIFNRLKEILKKSPSVFNISCEGLSQVITQLMTQADPAGDEIYLDCIEAFFDQPWLNEKKVADLNPLDIRNNSRLLKLVLNIVMTGYKDSKGKDQAVGFVNKFCEKIHEDFWPDFDKSLTKDIQSIFAHQAEITQLLAACSGKEDLGFFINSLKELRTARNKASNLNELRTYLKDKGQELSQLPGILRPLFSATLSKGNKPGSKNYVPEHPIILSNMPDHVQNAFWNFLKQRSPVDQQDCKELVKRLGQQDHTPEFEKTILDSLFALPAHLPLQLINNYLKFAPGQHHFNDARNKLDTLGKLGKVFNDFLLKGGFIGSSQEHSVIAGSEAQFDYWVAGLTEIPVSRSQLFFAVAQDYHDIPFSRQQQIFNAVKTIDQAEQVTQDHLKLIFDSARKILQLSHPNDQDYFITQLIKQIHTKLDLIRLNEFLICCEKYNQVVLQPGSLPYFYEAFDKRFIANKEQLITVFDAMKKAKKLGLHSLETLREEFRKNKVTAQRICSFLTEFLSHLTLKGHDLASIDASIPKLFKAYRKNSVNNALLDGIAQSLQSSEKRGSKLHEMFIEQLDLALADTDKIKRLNEFFNALEQYDAGLVLDATSVEALFKAYHKETIPSKIELDEVIGLVQKAKNTVLAAEIIQDLQQAIAPWDDEDSLSKIARLKEFVALLENTKKWAMPKSALDPLLINYMDGTIKNNTDLNKTFKIVQQAMQLKEASEEDDLSKLGLFSSFNHDQALRQNIMRHLHSDLLNLGQGFKRFCYESYKQLATSLAEVPTDRMDGDERNTVFSRLQQSYQQLIGFTRELVAITKNEAASKRINHNDGTGAAMQEKYSSYFSAQRETYASFWWKNRDRENQAEALFSNLNAQKYQILSRFNWYQGVLTQISDSQEQILNSDKGTSRNDKGYSRLHDITLQMFAKVARDFLADPDLSEPQKATLDQQIKRQIGFNIDVLRVRLSESDYLHNRLNALCPRNDKESWYKPQNFMLLEQCLQGIKNSNYEKVPKELHYIIDNLTCLVSFSSSVHPQKAPNL